MLGQGLESLIPPQSGQPAGSRGAEEEIEFPLPDISRGRGPAEPTAGGALTEPAETELVGGVKSQSAGDIPRAESVFHIEVGKISPNPHQPRRDFDQGTLRELADSIREFGILQPLVVSKIEKETSRGRDVEYELIAGERRLLAAKMLGLPTVPAIIRRPERSAEKLEIAVVENIQRADLSPIDAARAMARLQDEFGLTQREIATRLGKSREAVSNAIRLLSLPPEAQEAISSGKMNESQGRMLLSVEDPGVRAVLFKDMVKNNLSVRALETRIRRIKGESRQGGRGRRASSLDPEMAAVQDRLGELLGTKVDVKREGKQGKIIISFYSQEELDAVMGKLFRQNDSPQTLPPSDF